MQQVTFPYEILIRLNRDGVVGAQYQTLSEIIADDGVTVVAAQLGPVGPLAVAAEAGVALTDILGEAASAALQENEQLKGTIVQLQALTASLSQQLDVANAKIASLEAV